MRILVTGGAGFIGSNFVRHVHRERPLWELVVYDLLTYAGDRRNVEGLDRVTLIEADICDEQRIDAAVEPTRAINSGTAHLCIADPLGRQANVAGGGWSNLFASHPPMAARIAALQAMAYQGGR